MENPRTNSITVVFFTLVRVIIVGKWNRDLSQVALNTCITMKGHLRIVADSP